MDSSGRQINTWIVQKTDRQIDRQTDRYSIWIDSSDRQTDRQTDTVLG